MKKYKVLLTVLLVVLAAVAAVVVTGVLDINKTPGAPTPGNTEAGSDPALADVYQKIESVSLPLLKTDIENVFFTMSKQGDVKFYSAADGKLTVLTEDGNYMVEAVCSSQTLQARIHYIERNGKYFGCGLFTNLLYKDVLIYDYAFFKVTDMFKSYRDVNGVNYASKGEKLLLIDVDSTRFYSDDKVYSEAFVLNADKTTKLLLSNDQRSVGMDAKEKTDYKMFTDGILNQHDTRNVLFFSSRYYVDYAESGKADIFTSGGSDTNIDNVRYVTDIEGLYFWNKDGDTYFFRNNTDGTFSLKAYDPDASKTRDVDVFKGDLKKDYVVQGQYLFHKASGKLVNVLTDEETVLDLSVFGKNFKADIFALSENGRFCAVRGRGDKNVPAAGVFDLETGEKAVFADNIFANLAVAHVLNDGTVLLSIAEGENAAAYYQLICVLK